MKKIILIFCMYSCVASAGYICGPQTGSFDSYTKGFVATGSKNIPVAQWAIGSGCRNSRCDEVYVMGQAACVNKYWTEPWGFDYGDSGAGDACWCRRTDVGSEYDPGPWFMVDIYDSATDCESYCARECYRQAYGPCYGQATTLVLQTLPPI